MQTKIITLYHYVCGFLCPWQLESLSCMTLFDLVHAVHTKTHKLHLKQIVCSFTKVRVFSVFSNISGAVLGASWPTLSCIKPVLMANTHILCSRNTKALLWTAQEFSANTTQTKPTLEQCDVMRLTHMAPKTLNKTNSRLENKQTTKHV